MAGVKAELIVARPVEGGYTWTLPSRLGEMLRIAEARYGARDPSYTLLGVEFAESGPRLWYPGDCRHIVIQLGLACLAEPPRAYYQLAHECIHLLSPTGDRHVTALEEGLATLFSETYMHNASGDSAFGVGWHTVMPRYEEAGRDVAKLLAQDNDAIRRLREMEPCLSSLSADLILDSYPSLDPSLAHRLARKFGGDPELG